VKASGSANHDAHRESSEFDVRRADRACGCFCARAYHQRANRASHMLSVGHGVPPWLGLGPVASSLLGIGPHRAYPSMY
jgi:hypothetical protein